MILRSAKLEPAEIAKSTIFVDKREEEAVPIILDESDFIERRGLIHAGCQDGILRIVGFRVAGIFKAPDFDVACAQVRVSLDFIGEKRLDGSGEQPVSLSKLWALDCAKLRREPVVRI